MKRLLLLVIGAFLMSNKGCETQLIDPAANVNQEERTSHEEISIITIDKHQYILWNTKSGNDAVGGICHSESCTAPHIHNP
jgi:hypothetical protein